MWKIHSPFCHRFSLFYRNLLQSVGGFFACHHIFLEDVMNFSNSSRSFSVLQAFFLLFLGAGPSISVPSSVDYFILSFVWSIIFSFMNKNDYRFHAWSILEKKILVSWQFSPKISSMQKSLLLARYINLRYDPTWFTNAINCKVFWFSPETALAMFTQDKWSLCRVW